MKISISGTFSTGKTTLSNVIYSSVPGSILVAEHASALKVLFPQISWRSQIVRDYLLLSQLIREASAICKDGQNIVICDTGVLESIAHSYIFGVDAHLELLDELNHKRYDSVFICDYRDVPIVDNGIRHTDPKLRIRLQSEIIQVAQILGYTPIILSGGVDERAKIIYNWLERR